MIAALIVSHSVRSEPRSVAEDAPLRERQGHGEHRLGDPEAHHEQVDG
jgi:hypothetical protein